MGMGLKFSVYLSIQTYLAGNRRLKKDNLDWKHHVSDLKKWDNEAAAMYGVSSIPMSFLVDPNGIIVAKNLRGIELHRQLDKYVTSF